MMKNLKKGILKNLIKILQKNQKIVILSKSPKKILIKILRNQEMENGFS